MTKSISRRSVMKTLALAGVSAVMATERATAAEKLDVKDPTAVALGYVEKAELVDVRKYPSFVKGSNCENCLQLQGAAGNPYRPCATFKGKLVAVGGWCTAWTAEM